MTLREGNLPTEPKGPCYFEEKQRQILDARRRNCGIDGKPILFYSRRSDAGQKRQTSKCDKPSSKNSQYADLIYRLAQAKIVVTAAQVEAVSKELFPKGIDGIDIGTVLHEIIKRFKCQNRPDKQG